MDREYKAFISYRHLPLDISIAKKLHRRIEHYVIPRALRKNGVKKLGYVFRDQDELPLSSNLSDSIQEALDRTDFLIVVCSSETPKSLWVQREITYFLEHHDRDRVLALLIDGTPETSFPPQLTQAEGDDGSVRFLEPLAANIVADSSVKRDRLFATESLRLLAALIGCSFDELFKREQRYKTRRILAGAAAALLLAAGFIGVLLDRNNAIRENYQRALRNQSSYLAAESLSLLEGGDRMGAVALAMEALPREGEDRPLVSQAEYALGCALGIYTSPSNAIGLISWDTYQHDAAVRNMLPSPNISSFATMTEERVLTVWDTQSGLARWSRQIGEDDYFFNVTGFLDDDRLIAWGEKTLFCFSVADGAILWEADAESVSGKQYNWACNLPEAGMIMVRGRDQLFLMDASDGSLQRTVPIDDIRKEYGIDILEVKIPVSPDGRLAAVPYEKYSSGKGLLILDLEKAEVSCLVPCSEKKPYIYKPIVFSEDNALLYMTIEMDEDTALQMDDYKYLLHQSITLHCLDTSSGQMRWESKRTFSDVIYDVFLLEDRTLLKEPAIICAYANKLDILNAETGAIIAETEFSAPIVSVDLFNNRVYCVTEDGWCGQILPSDFSKWYAVKYFPDDLYKAIGVPGHFWIYKYRSKEVGHYCTRRGDPTWLSFTTEWESSQQAQKFFSTDAYVDSGCFALMDDGLLLLHDGDPTHPQHVVELPGVGYNSLTSYQLGGVQDGRFRVLRIHNEKVSSCLIDWETLETESFDWTREDVHLLRVWGDSDRPGWTALGYTQTEGAEDAEKTLVWLQMDDRLNGSREIPVGSVRDLKAVDAIDAGKDACLLYLRDLGEGWRIDLTRNEVIPLPAAFKEAFALCMRDKKALQDTVVFNGTGKRMAAAVTDNSLLVLDERGGTVCSIESETTAIYTFRFSPDDRYLLTVEADGSLHRYDAETGKLLSRSALYCSNVQEYTDFEWTFPDRDFFCLKVDMYMNLVYYEDWTAFAYIPCCYGYMEQEDQFCCYDSTADGYRYGAFPRHDLAFLLAYGQETLHGWQLSEKQRMRYGLD